MRLKAQQQVWAALLLLVALPAFARDWRIADFRTTAVIGGDGSAYIRESITLSFSGEFRGIHRTIPIEYPGPRGTNYTLFLKIIEVTDGSGHALKYEKSRKGAYLDLKIYIPGATDSIKTVQIAYTTPNAIRWFNDYDEFYWNVTGNDWPVPIDHAAAVVTFPESARGGLRAQAFTGVYGSHDQEATADVRNNDVVFETTNPLPMRGGLTIDIYIPKGSLTPPSTLTKLGWFLQSNAILFLPLMALAVMFPLWWYKGKDPDPGISIAPMYEPPEKMTPAECGALIDDTIDPRDITSTVIDLAVRGYIKIEEVSEQHLLFFSTKDYIFHLLRPREEWKDLASHESVLLSNLFANGDDVRMSSLKNRFYRAIPLIKQDILARLKQKGMYTIDPNTAWAYVIPATILIAAPFVLLQYFGVLDLLRSGIMAVVGIGATALILFVFGRIMTAKSIKGQRTRVAVLGFQEFMDRVEADRLKRMPPDTFEKFLPYAMALGVEHHWAEAFQDLLTEPPRWYVGPTGYGHGFNPVMFSSSMHSMSTNLHSVMVSAPRSSSGGSGFGGGGGGFSGGGFGGGGGSAF